VCIREEVPATVRARGAAGKSRVDVTRGPGGVPFASRNRADGNRYAHNVSSVAERWPAFGDDCVRYCEWQPLCNHSMPGDCVHFMREGLRVSGGRVVNDLFGILRIGVVYAAFRLAQPCGGRMDDFGTPSLRPRRNSRRLASAFFPRRKLRSRQLSLPHGRDCVEAMKLP